MFSEYIEAALEKAVYKTIEDEEPIFVSVPELPGAWATGKTVERGPQRAYLGYRRLDSSQAPNGKVHTIHKRPHDNRIN